MPVSAICALITAASAAHPVMDAFDRSAGSIGFDEPSPHEHAIDMAFATPSASRPSSNATAAAPPIVGADDEALEDVGTLRRSEVQRKASLVAGKLRPPQGNPVLRRSVGPGRITAGVFDFQHLSTSAPQHLSTSAPESLRIVAISGPAKGWRGPAP